MESTSLSSEQIEILKFTWNVAVERRLCFILGTSAFGSDYYAFSEGVTHATIDKRFLRCGISPILDTDGNPIKSGQFFFYDLFDVQKSLRKKE